MRKGPSRNIPTNLTTDSYTEPAGIRWGTPIEDGECSQIISRNINENYKLCKTLFFFANFSWRFCKKIEEKLKQFLEFFVKSVKQHIFNYKFWICRRLRGARGGATKVRAFLKIQSKMQLIMDVFWNISQSWAKLYLWQGNLIRNQVQFMIYCISSENQKEIKISSGKVLRDSARIQFFKIVEPRFLNLIL